MVRFLRKIFVVLPFILRLIFMFKPDYINFIQTIYNKNNNPLHESIHEKLYKLLQHY